MCRSDSNILALQLDNSIFFHSTLFMFVVLVFLESMRCRLQKGWDYLFVKHPATDIVNSAVDRGTAIHGKSLVRALSNQPDNLLHLRPRWHYEHQAEKARKLSEKLERDTELTRAIARERARGELQDETPQPAEERREQVWRGGTFI